MVISVASCSEILLKNRSSVGKEDKEVEDSGRQFTLFRTVWLIRKSHDHHMWNDRITRHHYHSVMTLSPVQELD